jgi:hypothetical protein
LVEKTLEVVSAKNPLLAAELAWEAAKNVPPQVQGRGFDSIIERLLQRLAEWADRAQRLDGQTVSRLCERWQTLRPQCPTLKRIRDRCAVLSQTANA